jgi:formylglycine-generating enzyme required for sulfatase activity
MRVRPSALVVIAVAATTGALLGRAADAGPNDAPHPAKPAAVDPLVAAMAGASARDDSEPDEPQGGNADNPYEEPKKGPALVKQTVVSQNGMLRLPGGRFTMGSTNLRAPANERPAHALTIGSFWIDRTEVTVGAYRACVDAGACAKPPRASATCTYDAGDPELPVSCVHWRDADAYCHFANKRLPSEREWEYAARATFPTSFPWGTGPSCTNAVTLLNEQSGKSCLLRPARVGSHPGGASVFGVMDMSGNVEEWTDDWYVESLGTGPAPRSGAAHVLRGGGWLSPPSMSRTTSRNWGSALEAGPNVGFRCARDGD